MLYYLAGIILSCILLRLFIRYVLKPLHSNSLEASRPVVGFFHPSCNGGGGGERVLWTAISGLQDTFDVSCIVYTKLPQQQCIGIIEDIERLFSVKLRSSVTFIPLSTCTLLEAKWYPIFTLLGQSIGSVIVGLEALFKFVPDIYCDTTGCTFTMPLFKLLGGCKVSCYVHYPTISTDMLSLVARRKSTYNNRQVISRNIVLSSAKILYYKLFAFIYGVVGGRFSDLTMVNGTWTRDHIISLWGERENIYLVYPPCPVHDFISFPLSRDSDPFYIVSVGQFRPEKDHVLQIRAFSRFYKRNPHLNVSLILVGGCRNGDDYERVKNLRQFVKELGLEARVEFHLNVMFAEIKDLLSKATVGLHSMWNEHFGICIVEYMAAGCLVVAHRSGGPLLDFINETDGERNGFLASSVEEYDEALDRVFTLSEEERLRIAERARASVGRFSETNFLTRFCGLMGPLVETDKKGR